MRELENQENGYSMPHNSLEHPGVELLERFALNTCSEDELELVETHIMACESCVCALENLELEIAVIKLALQQSLERDAAAARTQAEHATSGWKSWFTVPRLSWAGAGLAACAFCLLAFMPAKVQTQSERGSANVTVVPEWRSTTITLVDAGLPDSAVRAELVDENGSVMWSSAANSRNGKVSLSLPRITHSGRYYARLYSVDAEHELLGEFPLEVRFEL